MAVPAQPNSYRNLSYSSLVRLDSTSGSNQQQQQQQQQQSAELQNGSSTEFKSASTVGGLFRLEEVEVKQKSVSREDVLKGVGQIVDWVHGPGTKLLDSQRDLPRDFEEAVRIRKNHEQFEFKCMQALANYANLRDVKTSDNEVAEYLEKLEITIQDFLRRLQNRRQIVVSLYTFYRLQQELGAYFGEIADILRRESHLTIEDTEHYLKELERVLRYAENLYQQLYIEGERIRTVVSSQEILTIVFSYLAEVKPLLGKQMEALKIRLLETKKYLQLLVYERDARQTSTWLGDIIGVVMETYLKYNIGKTPIETQQILQQHRLLQMKSQETYDYGQELISGLTRVHRAQGKSTEDCEAMRTNLEANWRRLNDILMEMNDRYATADAFHVNADLNLERIERLILLICRELDSGASLEEVRDTFAGERDEIVKAYENIKRVGVGLMERIQFPVADRLETVNPTMIEQVQDVIKVKLFTLWLKIRELYYYLGQVIEITEVTERWQVIRVTIDKFYELLLRWDVRWQQGGLPFTLPEAENLIAEHRSAKEEVGALWREVLRDLDGLSREPETSAMAGQARADAERKMEGWQGKWQARSQALELRHRLLVRLRDLGAEIDELRSRLNGAKARPVDRVVPAGEAAAEVEGLLKGIPDTRTRMLALFAESRDRVQRDFERHIEPMEDKWKAFVKDLELMQMFLDLILRMLKFIDKLDKFIEELTAQLPRCRTREEAEPWFQKIQEYNRTTAGFDCEWLANAAVRLFGNPEKPRPVIERLRFITARLKTFETSILEMTTVTLVTRVESAAVPRRILRELPGAVTLPESGRCRLEVEFSTPAKSPEVEWQRNGRPLPTSSLGGKWRLEDRPGFSAVTCDRLAVEDAGLVSCSVRDPIGVLETACRLKVISAPLFVRELQSTRVRQGEPVLLQCQVRGSPHPDVEWLKDDRPLKRSFDYEIDNADGVCALKVATAEGGHSGVYKCRARNEAGEASTVAVVEVQEFKKGQFTRPLTDQQVLEGERLQLRVEFEGDPAPEVTWFRDSVRLTEAPPRVRLQIARNSSTCTIDPVVAEDGGLYTAQLRNPAGVQKSVCNVTVKPKGEPPICRSQLMDASVQEGAPVRLSCRITGKPTPNAAWQFNGRPLGRRPGLRISSEAGTGLHTLEIDEASESDAGDYKVVAENSEGRVETKCQLMVEKPKPVPSAPKFTGDICEELVANVSDKVTLQCTVHGHPLPTVSWFKDDSRVYTDAHIIVSGFEELHTLVIPYVRRQDEGVYRIVATNSLGSAECRCTLCVNDEESAAKRTTLVFHNTLIKEPPEFIRLFRDEVCKAGDDVILECEIHGIPDPSVWWSFNGEPISDQDRRFRKSSSGGVHSLFIKRVGEPETGRYSITAENSSGVATCSALLIVEEPGKTGSFEKVARLSSWSSNSHLPSLFNDTITTTTTTNYGHLSQLSRSRHTSGTIQMIDVKPQFDVVNAEPASPLVRGETARSLLMSYFQPPSPQQSQPPPPQISRPPPQLAQASPPVAFDSLDRGSLTVKLLQSRPQPFEAVVREVRHEVNYVEPPAVPASLATDHRRLWSTTTASPTVAVGVANENEKKKADLNAQLDALLMLGAGSGASGGGGARGIGGGTKVTMTSSGMFGTISSAEIAGSRAGASAGAGFPSSTQKGADFYLTQFEELYKTKFD